MSIFGDTPPSKIKNEKDYYLRQLTLIAYNGREYDISRLRVNICLYEELFGTGMTGTIEIVDTLDLPTLFPLIGEEIVKMVFTKQDPNSLTGSFLEDVILEFRVWKITDRQIGNEKSQAYTLHLLTKEVFNNFKTRIYKSWKSVKYSQMVQEIYDEFLFEGKPIEIEETKDEFNLCIGNKNPFEVINMIAARSTTEQSTNGSIHCPPFLFFEDRDKFNFKSLGGLLLQPEVEVYTRRLANVKDQKGFQEIEKDFKRLETLRWQGWWDNMRALDMGLFGQELVTVDTIRQKVTDYKFYFSEEWNRFPRLEAERFFTDTHPLVDSTFHKKVVTTNFGQDKVPYISERDKNVRPYNLENYMIDRTNKLAQMFHTRFGMSIGGDPRRKVGDVIKIELPEQSGTVSESSEEKPDRYYFGKYIIISMKHHISFNGYSIDLEIARDSFWQSVEHVDPFERLKEFW